MLTLSIESAGDSPRTLHIEKLPCVIGRSVPADIVLGGWRVARSHARIEIDAAGLRIVDQGSLAGTQVNGERIVTFGPLTESDEIVIGGHQLRVLALPGLARATNVSRAASDEHGLVHPRAQSELVTASASTGSDRYVWRRLFHRR